MNRKILSCSVAGLLLLVCPTMVSAQNSAIPWSSFNTGTGISTDENTAVVSATGEVLIGSSEGEDIHAASGFVVVLQRVQSTVAIDETDALPAAYALHQNYPNPFNPSTILRFDLPAAADIHIVVYDLLGREVVRLVDRRLEAGYHQLVWNGRDRSGRELPTGMYIVLMATPEFRKSIKLLLLK
ncbi:MAG: T9SS type A sorting domain-containing protein [Fidelibacterota bacterium]|nr:MAG: T9SS type A sorting domain-containing protein [Candidatus Neomarinimicrobiota bacterium]